MEADCCGLPEALTPFPPGQSIPRKKWCQPPNTGKLRKLFRQITQIWWLAPFSGTFFTPTMASGGHARVQ
jgi:hypothetical protein